MMQNETKANVQQMAIDNLALCIDISKDSFATEQAIREQLGIQFSSRQNIAEESQASRVGRDLFNQIKSRLNAECLPAM